MYLHPLANCIGAPCTPRAPKFFRIHADFRKICQNRMLAPPPGSWRPPPVESWIRPWHTSGLFALYSDILTSHFCENQILIWSDFLLLQSGHKISAWPEAYWDSSF